MAPILNWKKLMEVDPDTLPRQEELADRLLNNLFKVLEKKGTWRFCCTFFPKLSLVLHIQERFILDFISISVKPLLTLSLGWWEGLENRNSRKADTPF